MLSQSSAGAHWEAEEAGARDAVAAGMSGGVTGSAPMLAPLYPSISMDAQAVELASYILFPPPGGHMPSSLRSHGSVEGASAPAAASAAVALMASQAEAEEPLLFAERVSAQARGGLGAGDPGRDACRAGKEGTSGEAREEKRDGGKAAGGGGREGDEGGGGGAGGEEGGAGGSHRIASIKSLQLLSSSFSPPPGSASLHRNLSLHRHQPVAALLQQQDTPTPLHPPSAAAAAAAAATAGSAAGPAAGAAGSAAGAAAGAAHPDIASASAAAAAGAADAGDLGGSPSGGGGGGGPEGAGSAVCPSCSPPPVPL
ncbi:hypothetical protein CLOM_g24240 [Closterium sp. NIES-68]|nr:hypothetical protein CLOM_g24240 [Closterium sp. NIES-68]